MPGKGVGSAHGQLFCALLCLSEYVPSISPKGKRQFSRSIFDERLLPILHGEVIFSISGSEGKCLAKA